MTEREVAIEVVLSWAGNPLDSTFLTGSDSLRIGPGSSSWVRLPSETLPDDHLLVERNEGTWVLRAPLGAELIASRDGKALAPSSFGAERSVALSLGTTAEVKLGGFAFFVRAAERSVEPAAPKTSSDWKWTRWLAVAALLHAILLGIFAMTPRDASALSIDNTNEQERYLNIALNAPARPPEPPQPLLPSSGNGGTPSDSAGHRGGGVGEQVVESSSRGERRNDGRRQPIFTPNAENIRGIGALAVLMRDPMSFGDGTSPYTAGSALEGPGGLSSQAALLSMPGGPMFGLLDMGGTGVGTCDPRRETCAAGIVRVDGLQTRDPGVSGSVGLPGERPSRVPNGFRPGPVETVGGLSRDEVRRTIRRHINEVRFCYEQGLQRRPDLEGRVAVSFVIAPSGAVQSSNVMQSTVNDGQVGSCVNEAVRRWTFPQSANPTGVTYPFMMQSAN